MHIFAYLNGHCANLKRYSFHTNALSPLLVRSRFVIDAYRFDVALQKPWQSDVCVYAYMGSLSYGYVTYVFDKLLRFSEIWSTKKHVCSHI